MKKTCNGCKALDSGLCTLGFKNKVKFFFEWSGNTEYKPIGECPKPMTNKKYIELISKRGG